MRPGASRPGCAGGAWGGRRCRRHPCGLSPLDCAAARPLVGGRVAEGWARLLPLLAAPALGLCSRWEA